MFLLGTTVHAQLKAPRTSAPGMTQPSSGALPAAPTPADTAPGVKEDADKEAAGTAAAAAWLQMLDRRDWRSAWQASSQAFRSTVPIANWLDGIPKAREPLGALTERTASEAIYKTTLEGRPDGDYVTVSFAAKYANKPDAEEIVTTVREPDGKWRVMGYQTR
jgi:Protein of unknown function (DUF4019)